LGEKKSKEKFLADSPISDGLKRGFRLQNGRNAKQLLVANKAENGYKQNSRTADLMVRPRLPLMNSQPTVTVIRCPATLSTVTI